MTDTQNDNATKNSTVSGGQSPSVSEPERSVYHYESAGITERKGDVPAWLWFVVVSLLIWGFYYLVTYWNAPITPT